MRTALLAALILGISAPAGVSSAPRGGAVPGTSLPIVRQRHYVMSGAVRPLLFWVGRDDIGIGRIVWRRGGDGSRGYELLVGTEPSRAPRSLNRWGFISEEAAGANGALLALMTGSHETTYEDENVSAGAQNGGDFRAIVANVEGGTASWRLSRVRTAKALTVHDLDAAVGSIAQGSTATPHRQRQIGPSTRPGFLVAVADLLDIALDPARRSVLDATRIQYVFGEQLYELRVQSSTGDSLTYAGARTPVVKTAFETRTVATGDTSRFVVIAGTAGDLAGVPLEIEWQPRWWLRVRLRLT